MQRNVSRLNATCVHRAAHHCPCSLVGYCYSFTSLHQSMQPTSCCAVCTVHVTPDTNDHKYLIFCAILIVWHCIYPILCWCAVKNCSLTHPTTTNYMYSHSIAFNVVNISSILYTPVCHSVCLSLALSESAKQPKVTQWRKLEHYRIKYWRWSTNITIVDVVLLSPFSHIHTCRDYHFIKR